MGGQKISDALMGCLEIPIFIKAGVERFSTSLTAAKLSFLVSILLLPVTAWLATANPDFAEKSISSLLVKIIIQSGLTTGIYLIAIYLIAKQLDRAGFFWRFVSAQNWLSLTQIAMFMPIILAVMAEHWKWEEVHNFLIVLVLYGYVYQAFLITFSLRINWMLASSMSILGMAINDMVGSLIH